MDNTPTVIGEAPAGFDGVGYLIVRVFTARGAIPIPNALVTVAYADAAMPSPYAVITTDKSGRTPKIAMPTPPASLSLTPSGDGTARPYAEPFALYNVKIEREGFYAVTDVNVRIFAGITAIQDADLVPRAESLPQSYIRDDSVYIDESMEDQL